MASRRVSCWARLPSPNVVPIGVTPCDLEHKQGVTVPEPGWECSTCTYVNSTDHHSQCEICGSPRLHPEAAPAPAPQHSFHNSMLNPESEPEQQTGAVARDEEDAECSICIDTMDAADIASAECGHRFCTTCILQWLDTGHGHCPMCKASITHLRVQRQLDGKRVATPISEPVGLLVRARWRGERPDLLPPDNTLAEEHREEPGSAEWTNGFEEEEDLLLRGRASSRVAAEHRALVRATGGSCSGGGGGGGGRRFTAKKKNVAVSRLADRVKMQWLPQPQSALSQV
eukprot:COSAG02_NODE_1743_length_11100_cov_17.677575_11_plen_286_part_00